MKMIPELLLIKTMSLLLSLFQVPTLYFHFLLLANGCEDSQPASWNNSWGKLCDYVTGKKSGFPNRCDKTWNYCDNKNCGEFCKKSCNKC